MERYFVIYEKRVKVYNNELNMQVWESETIKQITASRERKEDAEKDFLALGFPYCSGLPCFDKITGGKVWERYILQCKDK